MDDHVEAQLESTPSGVMEMEGSEIEMLLEEVREWAASYSLAQFADFHRQITVQRARIFAVPWVKLDSRIEARSLSQDTRPYQKGQPYQRRTINPADFPVWSYTLREPGNPVRFGAPPAPITTRLAHSDVLLDCASCNAIGALQCGGCSGEGVLVCATCRGGQQIECKNCKGGGQERCDNCRGRGEVDCVWCSNGRDHSGQRCTHCYGRGFNSCAKCQNGYRPCRPCGSRGQLVCSGCNAHGYVNCKSCAGSGEVVCGSCQGSGELINSFYLSSTETDTADVSYITTPEFDEDIPADVVQWARHALTEWTMNTREAVRFSRVPIDNLEPEVVLHGQQLVDKVWRGTAWKSDSDRWDMSQGGSVNRINWQQYRENYLPLMELQYAFEGREYRLWSASPCMTSLALWKAGGVVIDDRFARHFRDGYSVYAPQSPIQEHFDNLSTAARDSLMRGELKHASRLVEDVMRSMPDDAETLRLRALILATQNNTAAIAAATAVGIGLCLYFVLNAMGKLAPIPFWSLLGRVTMLLFLSASPLSLNKIIFPTRKFAGGLAFVLSMAMCILCSGALK